MASFKEILEQDASTFFKSDEFASTHNINGIDKLVITDEDLLKQRQVKYAEGTYSGDLLFSIKKSDLEEEPQENAIIKFDYEPMKITKVQEDMGIYTITLEATLS